LDLSATDVAAVLGGGVGRERRLVVDTAWIAAAGPSYTWSPKPDAVRLSTLADREGLVDVALMGVGSWLGPRTWIAVTDSQAFSAVDVERGIVEQRTVASTGPWVQVTVEGAGPGEVAEPGTALEVSIEVGAPAWMAVQEVALMVGGVEVQTWTLAEPLDGIWTVQTAVDLEFGTVQASAFGAGTDIEPLSGERWAITSPVWVGRPSGTWTEDSGER
jgi:hypothetical protein